MALSRGAKKRGPRKAPTYRMIQTPGSRGSRPRADLAPRRTEPSMSTHKKSTSSATTALAKARRASDLRQAREDGWPEGFALLARTLVMTGLPLRRTKERQVVRKARLADGTLTVVFAAVGEKAELPFGADVNVLHYLFDRLDPEAPEPFIGWKSAAEYFRFWGMDPESHTNQRDLRERWRRLSNLVIQIVYESEGVEEKQTAALFPKLRLPKSVSRSTRNQLCLPGQEYGVAVNAELWPRLAQHRVPAPLTLLRELREEPFLLRLTLFLAYRSFAAKTASVIPWKALQDAMGSDDRAIRNFRAKIRTALREIGHWWPEVSAEVTEKGLMIGPSARLLKSRPENPHS